MENKTENIIKKQEEIAENDITVTDNAENKTEKPADNKPNTELSEEKKTVISVKQIYGEWSVVGEAAVGMAHRRGEKPTVCQDAYCFSNEERLIAAVCDGAGSSVLSEVGSQQMSQSVTRLLSSLEPIISPILDDNNDNKLGNKLSETIYRYSIKLLKDIAQNNKRETRDFRTTLLLIVIGKENAFWYKVGDGEIVIQENGKLRCVGKSLKGEYSNETVFVDAGLKNSDVQYGLLDAKNITGAALMSDGAAERLVSTDRNTIAERLASFLDLLRNEKLKREDIFKFFNDYETWKASTHDDKTLVLASRRKL